ncbi:unnamed protein product, partial [Mesorhabditis belari]|uniref:Uncharacterized protein n=1 Tax=Mesorhabditis belari TaxID=2138241 RepID=A0AAF3E9I9_9BILA
MTNSQLVVEEPITHVIFDFDGLLVDTEPNYTFANNMMLNRFGKDFTVELKKGQMGKKHDESIEWLLEQTGLTGKITIEDYSKDYDACLFELHTKSPAKPGAEKLVRHFIDHGIPTAICTGSDTKDFPIKSANHKHWIDLIPLQVLTGDDPMVKRGKPFPDGFLETMKRFESPPKSARNILVFEDAPNGVKAALAAGMHCIMVPDPLWRPEPEFAAQITQVLDSLEHFVPCHFGLPKFSI